MIRGQELGCGAGLKLTGFGSVKNDVAQNQKHLAILILSSLSKKFEKGSMATDLIFFGSELTLQKHRILIRNSSEV